MVLGPCELVGVFHHVSRHLSDRSKAFAIDWNMAGLQLFRSTDVGRLHLDGSGRAYFTTQRSLVDYRGEFGGTLAGRYEQNAHVAAIASGNWLGAGLGAGIPGGLTPIFNSTRHPRLPPRA